MAGKINLRGASRGVAGILCAWLAFTPARADTVADWNRIAVHVAMHSGQPLEYNLRAVAMAHVAMLETLNFIEKRYEPQFVVASSGPAGVAGGAAAAAAAHHVLGALYPDQADALDAALRAARDLPGERGAGKITGASIAALIRAVSQSSQETQAPGIHFGTSPLTWNGRVAELIEARKLTSIESARIHALVSTAITQSYEEARRARHECAPCIANPAVVSILEEELGARLSLIAERETADDQAAGRRIGRQAMARYRPISPETSSPAPAH
jgi:hypothetical protein